MNNRRIIGMIMLLAGTQILTREAYPYNGMLFDDLGGAVKATLILLGSFIFLSIPHEILHYIVARYFNCKPRFGIAWIWKMPCPCVRYESKSLKIISFVNLAPQVITFVLFIASITMAPSVIGYLCFVLAFTNLFVSVWDFDLVISLIIQRVAGNKESIREN